TKTINVTLQQRPSQPLRTGRHTRRQTPDAGERLPCLLGALQIPDSARSWCTAVVPRHVSACTLHDDQLRPARRIPRRAAFTSHAPAWLHARRGIADRARAPLSIDGIQRRHQLLRALSVVSVKEMRLYLLGWHQRGQEYASFFVAIAC